MELKQVTDLPTPGRRWRVDMAGQPELKFEDFRAGNYPEPGEDSIELRRKALQAARLVRAKLNIRPLTTATIIRQIRNAEPTKD